jgi:hypothetical protein
MQSKPYKKPRYPASCLSVSLMSKSLVPPETFERYNRMSEERNKNTKQSDSLVMEKKKKSTSAATLYKLFNRIPT